MYIRFSNRENLQNISIVKEIWNLFTDKPIELEALSDIASHTTLPFLRIYYLVNIITIISVVISIIGLTILVQRLEKNRSKDYAIKKVIGATNRFLLFERFITYSKPILASLILGISGYYYLIDFVDRFRTYIDFTSLSIPSFLLTILYIVFIYSLVMIIILKTVAKNPVAFLNKNNQNCENRSELLD